MPRPKIRFSRRLKKLFKIEYGKFRGSDSISIFDKKGLAGRIVYDQQKNNVHIRLISIPAEYQNKDIGSFLVKLTHYLTKRKPMSVDVSLYSVPFWKKLGFEEAGLFRMSAKRLSLKKYCQLRKRRTPKIK